MHPNKKIIESDIPIWLEAAEKKYPTVIGLIYLLAFFPEYRNLFYYRIGPLKYILNIFCRKLQALDIDTKDIGEGFFINHGYSTVIGAKSIGKYCRVSQQVTIGEHMDERPTIKDNVSILPGAVIVGGITIGSNSLIGANSTVFKDIPDNCTVFPPQPLVMKWKRE